MSSGARFTIVKADEDPILDPAPQEEGAAETTLEDECRELPRSSLKKKKTKRLDVNGGDESMALYEEDLMSGGHLGNIVHGSFDGPRSPTRVSFEGILDDNSEEEENDEEQEEEEEYEGKKSKSDKEHKTKLGTLLGVYLPTVQNIFGVLIFIRVTWLVGNAGTIQGFFIIFLCCCTTTLTAISMSAIATNGVVPAGGSYFMISRALGPEFGGAVGILFYLGFTIAGSMYVIGAIEILVTFIAPQISLFGDVAILSNALNNYRVYGSILMLILWFICFIGVRFVAKFGPLSLACVIFSIICIYIGMFTASPETSVKICYLGERLLALHAVTVDGVMTCTKNITGPIFQHYCDVGVNDTVCDPYFLENDAKVVAGVPGIASGNFIKNIPSRYTEKDHLIGLEGIGDRSRGEIVADITTSFTVLMAIYFPSVTGIMTGSNMSGDLKDAQRSIPSGTLAAVLSTSAVYLSCALLFAAAIEGDLLRDKIGESLGGGLVIAYVAWPSKWTVLIGSFLSTIGAGLQSINGAPRLLNAIAKDDVIPFLKVFGRTRRGEPFFALLLTTIIAEVGVLVGNLDYVTPVITMFFLMCYLFVNLACALQTLLKAPSWRPRYRFFHWTFSLLGVALCACLMVISSWYYALIAFAMAAGIYKYIEYKGAEKEWGDGIRGMAMSLARYSLLKVQQTPPHTKNWRPQLLVLCKAEEDLKPVYDDHMVQLASQLKAGKGLTLVATVLQGHYKDRCQEVQKVKQYLQSIIDNAGAKGFKQVVISKELFDGMCHLIQTSGLGGLKPNTVMIGWPYRWKHDTKDDRYKTFVEVVQVVQAAQMALLVVKGAHSFPTNSEKIKGTIDVWWIVHDGGLLVLLPYLLQHHKTWKNCTLRIFTVAQLKDNTIQMKKDLEKFMYQLRIQANVDVIEMQASDISAYAYERTLQTEQRIEMLRKMKLDIYSPQVVFDRIRRNSRMEAQIDIPPGIGKQPLDSETPLSETNQYTFTPSTAIFQQRAEHNSSGEDEEEEKKEEEEKDKRNGESSKSLASDTVKPDQQTVRRMHTAVRLNEVIRDHSSGAQLVILNLPPPPTKESAELHYMEFLEVLTEGLDRVLMVRGSKNEVITIYS